MSEAEPIVFPDDHLESGDEDLIISEGFGRLLRAVRDTAEMNAEEIDAYLDSGGYREA